MPPKTSVKQGKGYGLYVLKEILGGGAEGVIEELDPGIRGWIR